MKSQYQRTRDAMTKDLVTVEVKFRIGKEMLKKAKEIFAKYDLTIENGFVCMLKRTYEFNEVPFFELLPEEEIEI